MQIICVNYDNHDDDHKENMKICVHNQHTPICMYTHREKSDEASEFS